MAQTPRDGSRFVRAPLVPELLVTDIAVSLRFWCVICGFSIAYDRPEEGFAYLDLGGAQVMLEQRGRGRNWIADALVTPFGRGVNFEIHVPDIDPILRSLDEAGWALFMAPETKWYRAGRKETGVRQFLVQDPDGYLLRFSARIGERPCTP